MTRARHVLTVVLLVGIGNGCGHRAPDACERAVARLQRIEAARPAPRVPPSSTGGYNPLLAQTPAERARLALEECRHGRYGAYDPALGCAMTATSDQAAAACIDRVVHDVVHGASSR